ncbi:hypothetical protein R1sor_026802 [Riccia sorocarpa]|uniref:Uncharacterized protein n=1 Tax=Riccia sorocarpa TaxID=122646 RepID=A0ABD3GGK2_9MARC
MSIERPEQTATVADISEVRPENPPTSPAVCQTFVAVPQQTTTDANISERRCVPDYPATSHAVGQTFVAVPQQTTVADRSSPDVPILNTERPTPEPRIVANDPDPPIPDATAEQLSEVLTLSSDSPSATAELLNDASSSDVEIIDTTPRRRPPTRASPNFGHVRNVRVPTQYGMLVSETDVDVHTWHISRTTYNGAGPACSAATPCRHAPRALCKTKIRSASYHRRGVGVVSPTFVGECESFRQENAAQAEKIRNLLRELRDRNTEYAKALRQILLLTMDLQHSRIAERHASEELTIFRDDLKERGELLHIVFNDKAEFASKLADITRFVRDTLKTISSETQ